MAKKRRKHGKSILQSEKFCYLCFEKYGEYNYRNLHQHHCMHGTANRVLAEEDGLWIYACIGCHEFNKDAIHNCRETDLYVQQAAQQAYEEQIGTREEFVSRYGKNYL